MLVTNLQICALNNIVTINDGEFPTIRLGVEVEQWLGLARLVARAATKLLQDDLIKHSL